MVFNVTADVEMIPMKFKSIMARQLCSPVKWYDSVCRLMAENMEVFVEVGPGKVLTGLIKKILPKDYPGKIYTVNSMKQLERFLKETCFRIIVSLFLKNNKKIKFFFTSNILLI